MERRDVGTAITEGDGDGLAVGGAVDRIGLRTRNRKWDTTVRVVKAISRRDEVSVHVM